MGTSAALFLSANPSTRVTSFDLMHMTINHAAIQYLHATFPGRLTVIRGDSRETIARFAAAHPNVKCDVILVDGDHSMEGALNDLRAFSKMARGGAKLVADDMSKSAVAAAWDIVVSDGLIAEPELVHDNDLYVNGFAPCESQHALLGFARYVHMSERRH
jgi:cephalosporin hydroxylase